MILITNQKERTRFLRFAVVGAIGAVIDFGTFNLLTQLTPMPAVLASAISFIAAVISNFIWNRYWTYPDSRSKSVMRQITEFFVINLFGLGIRVLMFASLENLFISLCEQTLPPTLLPLSSVTIGHNITLALSIIIVMFWNFFVNRYWTYSDVS